jgi:hypothetical protein
MLALAPPDVAGVPAAASIPLFLATPLLLASMSMLESLQLLAPSMLIAFILLNKVSQLWRVRYNACTGFVMRFFVKKFSQNFCELHFRKKIFLGV